MLIGARLDERMNWILPPTCRSAPGMPPYARRGPGRRRLAAGHADQPLETLVIADFDPLRDAGAVEAWRNLWTAADFVGSAGICAAAAPVS